jgi:chromate reductase, NAD(P)H dehydrogenase (quinone)
MKILGITGSLRARSYNGFALKALGECMPDGLRLQVASLAEIPLYNGDLEEQGIPPAVQRLAREVAQADGLVFASPEYNFSISGVLKNAIDWLSRPAKDIPRVFGGRAFGIMGASGGPGGTRLGQAAWLPVLRALMVVPWLGKQIFVAGAGKIFDAEGKLVDEATRGQLGEFMAGFAAFVAAHGRKG